MLRKTTVFLLKKLRSNLGHELKHGYKYGSTLMPEYYQYDGGVFYRGHRHGPGQVFLENGFYGKGGDNSLVEHVGNSNNSAYVSTSALKNKAVSFAAKGFKTQKWLYTIENGLIISPVYASVQEDLVRQTKYGHEVDRIVDLAVNEYEYAAYHSIFNESIKDARSIEGYKTIHITQIEPIPNPKFMNMYFNIFIPSANSNEAIFIEERDRRNGCLNNDEAYITVDTALVLQAALKEMRKDYDTTHFEINDKTRKSYDLVRVKKDASNDAIVQNAIEGFDNFMHKHGARRNLFFFVDNKITEIIDAKSENRFAFENKS